MIVLLDLSYNISYYFIANSIQSQATNNNKSLGNISDEREPPLSPSLITTNYDT